MTCSRWCNNFCGYLGRVIVLIFGIIGIILSVLASSTCEFISFESFNGIPNNGLKAPFNDTIAANVGIFSFQLLKTLEDGTIENSQCINYNDYFFKLINTQDSIATAQICSVVAPTIVGTGIIFFNFINFYGSYLLAAIFFVLGAGIQAGTYSMIAEPSFCLDNTSSSRQDCQREKGIYYSGIAIILFFVAAALLCIVPKVNTKNDNRNDKNYYTKTKKTKITTTNNGRRGNNKKNRKKKV